MNKYIRIILVLLLFFTTACTSTPIEEDRDSIQIVTTIFPEYDWVQNIVKDVEGVDVRLLLDQGADLHNYQPTTDDMIAIANCDLFIYVGGESDSWVKDALKESINPNQKVICLLDMLGEKAKEEEIKEGMEAEEEEHDHEHEEETTYDEHVWLSLRNAKYLTEKITNEIVILDKKNEAKYVENLNQYTNEIDALDDAYQTMFDSKSQKTILVGDRFPFLYFVDDYQLEYYAAFVGCSAETEASFETVRFLAEKMDELQLPQIFVLESSDQKLAKTIVDNTKEKNQTIYVLDSMQSTTKEDVGKKSYLDYMKQNLDVLEEALQ